MNFQEYMPLALRTEKPLPRLEALRHSLLGMVTELGEVASEVKRHVIYGKPMEAGMRDHIAEELGDFQWYIPVGLQAAGVELPPQMLLEMVVSGRFGEDAELSLQDIVESMVVFLGQISCQVGDALIGEELDQNDLRSAYAALVVLVERMAVLIHWAPDDVRSYNIHKLQQRYPEAYSDEAAEARADKGGASHRES